MVEILGDRQFLFLMDKCSQIGFREGLQISGGKQFIRRCFEIFSFENRLIIGRKCHYFVCFLV